MKKNLRKIAATLLTAIFGFTAFIAVGNHTQKSRAIEASAATAEEVEIQLSEITCAEFAEFSVYNDTHRTRLIVRKNAPEWGLVMVNLDQPTWLENITINGASIAAYQAEYLENGSPALETSDIYIKDYNCAPICVLFTDDYALSQNVIDIYIPESYLPASEMYEVGIKGKIEYSYQGYDPCNYTLSGETMIKNPNAEEKAEYTITFDSANGTSPAQISIREGETIPVAEIPADPEKAETESHTYDFDGWYYTNAEGESVKWDFETDKVSGDLTLEAVFVPIEKPKFIVTFDYNNGSAMKEIEVYKGAKVDEVHFSEIPQKQETDACRYTFEKWLNADTGAAFDIKTPITANVNLIASYTETAKHAVIFDPDNGTAPTEIRVCEGETFPESQIPADPEKAATESAKYTFLFWSADGKTKWDPTTAITGALTIKAYYSTKNIYAVSVNGAVQRVEAGELAKAPETNPTKAETEDCVYTFDGWFIADTDTRFTFDTPINSDLELVPCFTETKKYTVTIGENTERVLAGTQLTEPTPKPTKVETESHSYDFGGWYYTNAEGESVKWDFETDKVSGDLTLEAVFVPIEKPKFIVTFDYNNGSAMKKIEVYKGAKVNEAHFTEIPQKQETDTCRYTFEKWLNADTGAAFDTKTPITANLNLIASYTETAKYKVTIGEEIQYVIKGGQLSEPATKPTMEETESHTYVFDGWYYTDVTNKEVKWNFEKDKVSGELTLEAKFQAIEKTKFTVTFDPDNGGSSITTWVYDGSYIKEAQIPEPPMKLQNGHTVYTFYCWSADGKTAWEFDRKTAVTGDLTLKAYYSEKNVYTVSIGDSTKFYEEGSYIERPDDPAKQTTAEYSYDFDGWYYLKDGTLTRWDFDTDKVTSDVALVAQFIASKVCYTVSIYLDGKDGWVITETLEWGTAIPYPEFQTKEGYEQLGWVYENGSAAAVLMPTQNISVYANWQMIEYLATVECSNGVSHTETFTIETADKALENLKNFLLLANSEQYTYAWETSLPESLPLEDCTYRANATKVRYKLTIVADPSDAEAFTKEQTLVWGEELALQTPQAPRGKDFLGWTTAEGDDLPKVMPVGNLTVYGNWEWSEYSMTVIDGEGAQNEHVYTVKEADDPLYVQALFAKYLIPENAKAYEYRWSEPLPETLPLENGKIYKVEKTAIEYTVTFKNAIGVVPVTFTVETLHTLTFPEVPGKIGYTAKWDKTIFAVGLEDITVTAVYTPIEYTITFQGVEDVEPIVFTVETLQYICLPEVPKKNGYGGKWDKKLSDVGLENITFTAIYEVIEYTITFEGANVSPIKFTIETLPTLTFPEVPEKIGYAGVWSKTPKDLALENTTVEAIYEAIAYTISFAGVEGIAPIQFTVETLSSLVLPSLPKKEGYKGAWDKELSQVVLEDTTITAVYTPIEYTVTFSGVDVAPIKFTIETLPALTFPEVPEKEGYIGAWNKTPDDVALENTIVAAIYLPIEYTITFMAAEDIEPIKFTVDTLSSLTLPAVPQKRGYTAVWNKELFELGLENVTLTAVYTPIAYTVTFSSADVAPIQFTIETLPTLTFPEVPKKAGYTGAWDKTPEAVALENTAVAAIYTPIEYTVTFKNADGIPALSFTVENKDLLVFPEPPSRIGYTAAWDKQPAELNLENEAVTALYTPIEYTVEFINAEGVAPLTFTVETMDELYLPTVPEKVGYRGKWDKSLSDLGLRDETLTAVYTPIAYMLTFAGVEGVDDMTFTVETLPNISLPEVPQKLGYTGVWDKTAAELELENSALTAVYTIIEYTLTFVDADGVEDVKFTVETLSSLTLPAVPQKNGYTASWDKDLSEIGLKDTTIAAVYTPIEYTISFADVEGIAPIRFTVEDKGSITLPALPEKLGYAAGWDKSLSEIGLENVTLHPIYTVIAYTLTFAGVEGLEPMTFTVETLSKIVLPAVPEKAGYTGVWDKTAAEIALENTTVTAIYTEIPAMEQVKDYGDKLASSCFGSVNMSAYLLTLIGVGTGVLFKKKED